jgi:PKD repeat protein
VTSFSTVAGGTDIIYQWQESTDGGTTWSDISDGGIYFGANMNKLNLYGTTRTMDGYQYHVIVTNCSSPLTSANATLTVRTIPEITKEPGDTTICSTQGAVFQATATGTALTYQWQVNTGSGFGNIDVNPSYTGHISGATSNTLTITNALPAYNDDLFMAKITGACGSPVYTSIVTLTVNTPPAVSLSPSAQAVCDEAGTVYFRGRGTGMIDSLRWQVNTGSGWNDIYDDAIYSSTMSQQLTVMNPPVSYNGYQYRLALKASCQDIYTGAATLTVHSNPVVSFVPATIPACGGIAQTLTPVITSGSGTWNQHTWTGDIGPLNNPYIQTPLFRTLLAGSYSLNYKVRDTNQCYGNGDLTVTVDAPDATFTQDATSGCTNPPFNVTFTKDMTGYTSFTWDYGDGTPVNTTVASPSHIFTNATPATIKYYTVKLTVNTAGCSDTRTSMVTVYPAISAAFTADKIKICSNETITFTGLQGAHDYLWDYGDGVSAPGSFVASHKYTNFGTSAVVDTVTLTTTSSYSCTDKKKITVTVMPVPSLLFTALPAWQNWLASGNFVTITNATANAATWIYEWKFGDGTTSTAQNPPAHDYTSTGSFKIWLKGSNSDGSCPDSIYQTVTVAPPKPIASFDSIPNGCAPQYVTFKNTTQNVVPGTTYLWDFGDNNYSTTANPTYTYQAAGDFKIMLKVTGPGGKDSVYQVVHIYQSPKAYFEVTPQLVFVNDENVRCFNLTTNGDTYKWDFGDGETSTETEPFHKYMEEGVYDITLWARSANDCYDKYTLSPAVTVQPAGVLRFASVFTPDKNGPQEITTPPTGGDAVDQFFYPPIREKVITYKLQIFNRLGVLIFQSDNIEHPWNGYYKGKLCPQGVYVWYVEGKYATGKVFKKVGDITLLH